MSEAERAVERLLELVREETGNVLPRARQHFLEEVAQRRSRAHGYPGPAAWVDALERGELDDEWRRLVPLLTVKESFFFRAVQQFVAMERVLLPDLVRRRARSGERTLRVWSAACARGEEPATVALLLQEHPALVDWTWKIVATDLDEDALATARRGLYGERAVSQVPEPLLEKWFTPRGNNLFELAPRLRERIEYRSLNLARPPYRALPEEPFDIVLLRNILIYFRRPLQRRVVAAVASHLAPDGYLFLGGSETLWQIDDRLLAQDLGDCFTYRHPDALPEEVRKRAKKARRRPVRLAPPPPPPRTPPQRPSVAELLRMPVAEEGAEGASEKALEEVPKEDQAAAARTPSGEAIEEAVEEAAEESSEEAAGEAVAAALRAEPVVSDTVTRGTPPERPAPVHGESVQDLLDRAARSAADNDFQNARRLAREARERDASEPAVYALEGFLHDLLDDADAAVTAYRAALYLEPHLYQARLLLADCLLRLGHADRAEHEYRQVLSSLQAERGRELVVLGELPLPERGRAERRCRQVLGGR